MLFNNAVAYNDDVENKETKVVGNERCGNSVFVNFSFAHFTVLQLR